MLKPTLLTAAVLVSAVPLASACGSSDNAASGATPAKKPAPAKTTASATAAPAVAADGKVDVDLSEWKIAPSAPAAKAGKVTFTVKNTGKVAHEMVILKTDKPADQLGSGSRISEKSSVGEVGDVAAGASKTKSFHLKPGHYALICNIAGHYTSGMRTDFTVQ